MPEDQNNQGRVYRPNTFQMPNVMIDVWLTELSGSEFKVAAYICRHTYGWNKESDGISLSQMMNGVRRRDGSYLDRGTGIKSKETLLTALRSLEKRRRIRRDRKRSIERGDEPTVYRLIIVDEEPSEDDLSSSEDGDQKIGHPVGGKSDQGGGKNFRPGGWAENPTTQNTLEQNTSLQNTYKDSNNFESLTQKSKKPSTLRKSKKRDKIDQMVSHQIAEPKPQRRSSGGMKPIGELLERHAPSDAATNGSQQPSQPGKRGRPVKYPATPGIEAMLTQWTDELHDSSEHARSNVTQAARLWHESGVSEDTFHSLLYEARQRTKQAGNVEKMADGAEGELGFRNRMPYFFACLKKILNEDLDRPVNDRAPRNGQGKSSSTKRDRTPNLSSGTY